MIYRLFYRINTIIKKLYDPPLLPQISPSLSILANTCYLMTLTGTATGTTGFPLDANRWSLDFGFLIIHFSPSVALQPLTFLLTNNGGVWSLSGKLEGGRICTSKKPSPAAQMVQRNFRLLWYSNGAGLLEAEPSPPFGSCRSQLQTQVLPAVWAQSSATWKSLRVAMVTCRSSPDALKSLYTVCKRNTCL